MSTTANRLAELRESRDWHRTKVAAAFNVGEKTVYRWEVGETAIPSDFIPDLANLLEVTPDHLMGWDRAETEAAA
jgi:transcriptional regulator with XRE-family HTH domain